MDEELFAFATGLDAGIVRDAPKAKRAKKSDKATDPAPRTSSGAGRAATLRELTASLGDDVGHADVRRRVSALASALEDGCAVVAPALEPAVRERVERGAAYDAVSRDANKWAPVMRRNRSTRHRVFGAVGDGFTGGVLSAIVGTEGSEATPPAGVKTALAAAMDAVLSRAGLASEEQQLAAEDRMARSLRPADDEQYGAAKVTLADDDNERVVRLAKERALVLWTEQKRRQQARIKSKTFRKHVRREAAAIARKSAPEEGEDRFKAELERARERVSLRTRKASKWASAQMAGRRGLDARTRDEAVAQVREKERLRQEIYGRAAEGGASDGHSDGHSESSSDFSSDSPSEGDDRSVGHNDEVDALFDARDEDAPVGRRVFGSSDAKGNVPLGSSAIATTKAQLGEPNSPKGGHERQMELIREAFGDDGVFEEEGGGDFDKMKAQTVAAEGPKVEDVTLPGWGTWAGAAGDERPTRTRVLRSTPGIAPASRRDAGLAHVVIHEGRAKRTAGLLAPAVPFGFGGDAAAYEAAVAQPVGAEWTSATAFAQRIRPRIRTTPGAIIAPASLDLER